MKRMIAFVLAGALLSSPAFAQFGGLTKAIERAKKAKDTFTVWTPEQETAIGEASAAKLIHIFGLYEDDPELVKYVNLVGLTVARNGSRPIKYRFGILNTEAITAMGLPGGYVFITRGALANMKSEAELAGVLAHEVAHVDGQHLEKEVRAKKTTKWAVEEGSAKIPGPSELRNIANDVVATALTSRYSQGRETDADKRGTELAARAGYNPAGLRDFLQVLSQASTDPMDSRRVGLWNATHPPFTERVNTLNNLLKQMGNPAGETLEARFKEGADFNRLARKQREEEEAKKKAEAEEAAKAAAASGTKSGSGTEYDGIVSKGEIVLMGGKIPEGTRVKVKPAKGAALDGIVSKGSIVLLGGKLAEGDRVKVSEPAAENVAKKPAVKKATTKAASAKKE